MRTETFVTTFLSIVTFQTQHFRNSLWDVWISIFCGGLWSNTVAILIDLYYNFVLQKF